MTEPDAPLWTQALIESRRTTLPKRLVGSGPTAQQRQALLTAAGAAPDHDRLQPWRLVEVPAEKRPLLGAAFVQALKARDPSASVDEVWRAAEKAQRAPWLLLAVCRTQDAADSRVPAWERWLSLGAAVQNLLLLSTAMGFGSALTSGQALQSPALRTLFQLGEHEVAGCFISIGQVHSPSRPQKRPPIDSFFSPL